MEGIDPKSLHHTYIITGHRVSILDSLVPFIEKEFGVTAQNGPDFFFKEYDSFYVEDARSIREMQKNKTLGSTQFFIISAKNMNSQAQNALLKISEEPTSNTCFFFVLPSLDQLLPTLLSRSVVIEQKNKENRYLDLATRFLDSNPKDRLEIALEFHEEPDLEKVQEFLGALESELEDKRFLHDVYDIKRKIGTKGVSVKTLLEHLSMVLPFKK